VGFEPTISAGERPQTYALDRAATWTGSIVVIGTNFKFKSFMSTRAYLSVVFLSVMPET